MVMTEKKPKQLTHYLTFAKSDTALFEFLKGKTKLAVEAADIFYTPMALIETEASIAEIDRAVVRSVALLKAQIEILQGTREAYLTSQGRIEIASKPPPFSVSGVEPIDKDGINGESIVFDEEEKEDDEDDNDFPIDID
jgi:hypothetical protein